MDRTLRARALGYNKADAEAGITLPTLPQSSPSPTKTTIRDGMIYLYFSAIPAPEERAQIKACSSWRFHGDLPGKPWSVAATRENAEKLSAIGIEVGEISDPPQTIADYHIQMVGDKLHIYLTNPITRADYVAILKRMPDTRWRPELDGKPWVMPISNARLLKQHFDLPDDIADYMAHQDQLALLSNNVRSSGGIAGIGGTPYPFQLAGVEFLQAAGGRAILADEMGLGKTIQAILYLHNNSDALPALIVCPASVKLNWAREIKRWSPRLHAVIADGMTPQDILHDNNVVIINWDLLAAWQSMIQTWGIQTIVADEAHYAKNPKARRTQILRDLAKSTPRMILITGTPVVNRPAELWTLLNIVDPKSWPSFWGYAKRYCDPKNNGFGWDFSGASNLDELHERIRPLVCRRTKSQVLAELPEKRRAIVPVEFDTHARAGYEEAIHRYLKSATKQINVLVEIEAARQAVIQGKLAACIEWIKDYLADNGKLVVFAWHTDTIHRLTQAFPGCVALTGDTPPQERQAIVDRFQNDPECRLFVGNIQAAGVGVTLTAASSVAFVEFAWTPGDMEQAYDRIHRIGQRQAVIAYYLVGQGTIDEDIADLLEQKRQIIETIHDGAPRAINMSILDDLTKRLLAKYGE